MVETKEHAKESATKGKAIPKRMLKVSFTGKEMLEGRVFDTTDANVAKENNLFDEKRAYKPLVIILGEKELLPLVEEQLYDLKAGEEKSVKLMPKDGFGERQSDLVRVVPLKSFIDQKINPAPGLLFRAGDYFGKVQSVSGGRVRVDFNHPLAGRELEYEIKLEGEVTDKKEIAERLFEKYYSFVPGAEKEVNENKLLVSMHPETIKNLEKINASIKKLGEEFGVIVEFKGNEKLQKIPSPEHVHGHEHEESGDPEDEEGNHGQAEGHGHSHEEHGHSHEEHGHDHEIADEKTKKSFNRTLDEIRQEKKPALKTETTSSASTIIQRPKKK